MSFLSFFSFFLFHFSFIHFNRFQLEWMVNITVEVHSWIIAGSWQQLIVLQDMYRDTFGHDLVPIILSMNLHPMSWMLASLKWSFIKTIHVHVLLQMILPFLSKYTYDWNIYTFLIQHFLIQKFNEREREEVREKKLWQLWRTILVHHQWFQPVCFMTRAIYGSSFCYPFCYLSLTTIERTMKTVYKQRHTFQSSFSFTLFTSLFLQTLRLRQRKRDLTNETHSLIS